MVECGQFMSSKGLGFLNLKLFGWDVRSEVNTVPKQWGQVTEWVAREYYLGRREREGR